MKGWNDFDDGRDPGTDAWVNCFSPAGAPVNSAFLQMFSNTEFPFG